MDTAQVLSELCKFKKERRWNKFHTLINLSRALNIESSEVEKIFLWKKNDDELSDNDLNNLKLELADVLTYAYYMCNKLNLDPNKIIMEKLALNKTRHWDFEDEK